MKWRTGSSDDTHATAHAQTGGRTVTDRTCSRTDATLSICLSIAVSAIQAPLRTGGMGWVEAAWQGL